MNYKYKTHGVFSRSISFDLEDNIVSNVMYDGGCHGNLQGIAKLVEGKDARDIINLLSGIKCGYKMTSCPDQLSRALQDALNDTQKDGEEE